MHLFSAGPLQVKFFLFCKELFHRLAVHLIGDAAVDGADGSALGFFVKTLALGAFVGYDIVDIDADGSIALVGIDDCAIQEGKGAFYAATVGNGPFDTAFVDGIIGAFGLAGAAVDTFFCYLNSHFVRIRE
jgi:hypothetical protein